MGEQRKRKINWSSAIGWAIFILVIAGGRLFSLLQSGLGANRLPSNLIAYLIGGLVVLSIAVSAVRSVMQASGRRGETRLPTSMSTSAPQRGNAPMPPFGGSSAGGVPAAPRLPQASAVPVRRPLAGPAREAKLPPPPRFEPIVDPRLVIVGLVGLALIGAAALLLGLL
jgi:hypothetical protein